MSELIGLKWEQIDLKAATLRVRRVKGSVSGIHGLDGTELRLLRALRRENPHGAFCACRVISAAAPTVLVQK